MKKQIVFLFISFLVGLTHLNDNVCAADDSTKKKVLTEDKIFETAIKELKTQDKRYSVDKYEFFKLSKEGSYWRIEFKRKNNLMTGQYGSIYIEENGTIKHYFGGM